MVVALGALKRRAEPDRSGGVHAIDHLIEAAFLRFGARLDVGRGAAVEAGGDAGRLAGVGQEISRDLGNRKRVERHVGIQRGDHPVTIGPQRSQIVALVAVGIGIAGQIEPHAGPADAKLLAGKQPVDQPLVGIRRGVAEEGRHSLGTRRKPSEVEGEAADQRFRRGGWRKYQPLLGMPRSHPAINHRVAGLHPGGSVDVRRLVSHGGDIGPVRCVGRRGPVGSGGDPCLQEGDLRFCDAVAHRGHRLVVFACKANATEQLALGTTASHESRPGVTTGDGGRTAVEPQPRLLPLRSVALDAVPPEHGNRLGCCSLRILPSGSADDRTCREAEDENLRNEPHGTACHTSVSLTAADLLLRSTPCRSAHT